MSKGNKPDAGKSSGSFADQFDKTSTKNKALGKSLKITLIYFLFGCAWILLSDSLNNIIFLDPSRVALVSLIKGLFYVVVTAALIFGLIYPSLRKVIDIQDNLHAVNTELEKSNTELLAEKDKLLDSENRLKESETLFRAIFDQATIGIAIINNEEQFLTACKDRMSINPMFEKITGRTKEELSDAGWTDITHPDDLPGDAAFIEKIKTLQINGWDMEKRLVKPDGSEVWVHMIVSPLYLENMTDFNYLCLIEDITRHKEMENSLFDSERSKSVLLSNLPGMAYRCNYDREWTMQFVSEGCLELTGYKPENLLFNRDIAFNDLISPEYREFLWEEWTRVLEMRRPFRYEYEIVCAGGRRKWVLEMGQGVYGKAGNVEALEGIIIDITIQKEREYHIKYLNEHDYLTGLYNRRYFEEVLNRDSKSRYRGKRAVVLVRLQNFNLVNLTYGYHFGEQMIRELAAKLSALCARNCQLFQISIERFAFYIKGYKGTNELTDLCGAISEAIKASLDLRSVGGSIGILEIGEGGRDAESILKNATIAAENTGENRDFCHRFFDSNMEAKIIREAEIKNELSKAVTDNQNGGLYLQYQPIVDAETGDICAFEALARFRSEKLGEISPLEFIPIAEETQLIVPLGKRIMRLAFGFLKQLEEAGFHDIVMSINVSSIQLIQDGFLPELKEIINEMGVDPQNLCIEITESVFSGNYQEINNKLKHIKDMGARVAIDDFGTGYSSLARERELNITCVKIDKYFIDKLRVIDPKEAITSDIISMAHKLGHYVIAEGVEYDSQRRYLTDNNCDYLQGFLFSRPLCEDAAVELLKAQKPVNPA
jgi:PAS domain S-box-containing protein/diguanylate cyclase (GGDEF)-like protein